MAEVKIGIIRESRIPVDKRAPLSPEDCKKLQQFYPNLKFYVQPSKYRIFADSEYEEQGIPLEEDLSFCDYLFGVKEVALENLINEKTYFFFSHTTKKQPQNRLLLKAILNKKIRLIDYECLRDDKGERIVAFGYFAGMVGAYNALLTYGKKNKLFNLKRAHKCFDYQELKLEMKKIKLPSVKIALTGGGNVANGAISILEEMGIKKVDPQDYRQKNFNEPVFTQLRSLDFYEPKPGYPADKEYFYKNPNNFVSCFDKYTPVTDILISGAYWNPDAPKLFSKEQMRNRNFRIKVVADITCDIGGPIPCTLKSTSIINPVYDYNPFKDELEEPFSGEKNISVMAVDNLPCELARDASENFSDQLRKKLFPVIMEEDKMGILEKATIAKNGELMPDYKYLSDYAFSN